VAAELTTVLLVDNDIAYANLTQQYLTKFAGKKFKILWKPDADSTLKEFEQNNSIDILLMEYDLPGKNGLELVKELRERRVETPVILLTTTKDFRVAIDAMKLGVDEYLLKEEVSETFLPRTILNVLDKVRLKKQIMEAERNRIFAERRTEAIRELIVAICHEFNNPLTAIKLTVDAIARHKLSAQEKTMVAKISNDVQAIEDKIRKLQNLPQGT
jgi:DNA-binding response OmpR family regulator